MKRMDIVPVSIALVTAKESGWGHLDLLLRAMLYLDSGLGWSGNSPT